MSADLVAHFRARYTEEALRSTQDQDHCRSRFGSTAWNEEIARPLVDDDPPTAEALYGWAIEEAQRIEGRTGMRLKKGVEYCNLGVAQLNQGRIRDAYRSFELAEAEDHAFDDASHAGINVLEGMLLLPAGEEIVNLVRESVSDDGQAPAQIERARKFWVRIGREHRLRLREVLPDCRLLTGTTDSQRHGRLSALGTLAGVAEDVLRLKYAAANPHAKVPRLLQNEFGTVEADVLFQGFLPCHGEVDPGNFDQQIRSALAWSAAPLTRSMIVFYVVRNYDAHYVSSALDTLANDSEFDAMLRHVVTFASAIAVPAPVPGPLTYARLPIGVSRLLFPATTPVSPDQNVIREWARQVTVALTGMVPVSVAVGVGVDRISVKVVLPQPPDNEDHLREYLGATVSIGGHFSTEVEIEDGQTRH